MRFARRLTLLILVLSVVACGGGDSVGTSAPAPLAPQISMQPANQSVDAGQTASFSVMATGTAPLQYQWNKGGAAISGATSASYTTPSTTSADNGASFTVTVSNSVGSVMSAAAVLTVAAAPQISVQPTNQSVTVGQTASFSVTATGAVPLQYQWSRSGATVAGATSAVYTTAATTAADNGATFRVVVTNSAGTVTSQAATLTVTAAAPAPGPDVVTYKYDASRSGQNTAESKLTLTNVSSASFGKLYNLTVDGKVDAQPLFVSSLAIAGTTHDVVFVETEHGSVYAFDANTGTLLWQVSLLASGETTSDARGCGQVTPEIGITATPVIDRSAGAHGTMYAVAMSKDSSANYHQRLHALDLTTGAELGVRSNKPPTMGSDAKGEASRRRTTTA